MKKEAAVSQKNTITKRHPGEEFIDEVTSTITDKTPPLYEEKHLTVIKRDGSIVPFHSERVQRAIEAAFCDTKKLTKEELLSQGVYDTVIRLTNLVIEQITALGNNKVSLSVEGIQDIVEVTLMKNGFHDVARDYIIYRDHHKAKRDLSPENLRIYRSDGSSLVKFKPMKIATTLEKVFRKAEKLAGEKLPEELIETVNALTLKITERCLAMSRNQELLSIALVQDMIEEELMAGGYFQVAKAYILHRAKVDEEIDKATHSTIKSPAENQEGERSFTVLRSDGSEGKISETEIRNKIHFACRDYEEIIDVNALFEMTMANFYEGIKDHEVDKALIMSARAHVEKDPSYSSVASRLLLDVIYREVLEISAFDPSLEKKHRSYFSAYIKKGISLESLSPKLLDFDLEALAGAMDLSRDDEFQYLGLQTLYDRYFIHHEKRRLETPQILWMRVAMGLSLKEKEKTKRAIEFYNILSQFYFVSATPTLFNSGTTHSQLSSCYLSTIMDDLSHIFKVISDDAQLSKWAGGIGNDWTNIRSTGSLIKGTNGESQGVIPFLKVANDTAVAVNQGGKRKGAMCAYLETWHLDVEDFLELRKNTGDERRRTHDMNTANWIPDLFMKRVIEKGEWTLFSPKDVPDLHDLYGKAFEKRYNEYEKDIEDGKIKLYKKVEALALWRKMLSMLYETGHPWITFKDPSNIRSPQDHVGVVHSSNLCTEILLNTSKDETAVCNLGSVNLAKHVVDKKLDEKQLAKTVSTAIRMLDNVIDINFYPTKEAKASNVLHRPIGLGLMGFQDALYLKGISYASHEAVEFADESSEMISYYALLTSSELAKERGQYSSYKGSKWDRGYLPIDTLDILEKERGGHLDVDRSSRMDWEVVRASIKKHGMRNSNTMAIAPTATIANISGVVQSIEPTYKNLYVKSNLSGEFTISNMYLVEALKKLDLWDDQMLDDLKYYDGSILEIDRIPDEIKQVFLTAFEIDPEWLIDCASRRQKWLDMGESFNMYLAEPNGKKLHDMYIKSWVKGLKTNYYLRSLAATQIEKSTTDINKRGLQPRWMKNTSASGSIVVERETKPASCSMEEGCESCQ